MFELKQKYRLIPMLLFNLLDSSKVLPEDLPSLIKFRNMVKESYTRTVESAPRCTGFEAKSAAMVDEFNNCQEAQAMIENFGKVIDNKFSLEAEFPGFLL